MKVDQVKQCIFSSWYNQFKEATIKSRILPLPKEFVDYLLADGLVLPEGCVQNPQESSTYSDDEDHESWDDQSREVQAPKFPKFEADVKRAIRALGGEVFPKLNWSAPRDASWISATNTLKCTSLTDLCLLLKSSDFISHDLTQPFNHCDDYDPQQVEPPEYELVLRRWHDLVPAGEYRCFVKNNTVIGISQRHHSCFYQFVYNQRHTVMDDIVEFFNRVIKDKFKSTDYVFDVYRKEQGKVYLLDFNPYGEITDSLLFTWDELLADEPLTDVDGEVKMPAFRCVKNCQGVQPNPYKHYAMPLDFVDLSTGMDANKFMDFLNLKIQSPENESPSEDEAGETTQEKK